MNINKMLFLVISIFSINLFCAESAKGNAIIITKENYPEMSYSLEGVVPRFNNANHSAPGCERTEDFEKKAELLLEWQEYGLMHRNVQNYLIETKDLAQKLINTQELSEETKNKLSKLIEDIQKELKRLSMYVSLFD